MSVNSTTPPSVGTSPPKQRSDRFAVDYTWLGLDVLHPERREWLVIDVGTEADFPKLSRLDAGAGRWTQQIFARYRQSSGCLLVAAIHGKLVGFIAFGIFLQMHDGVTHSARLALQRLVVAARWRRNGIGRSLIAAAERMSCESLIKSDVPGDYLSQATIPEGCLRGQQVFRAAGYTVPDARCIIRGGSGDEDEYTFVRKLRSAEPQ